MVSTALDTMERRWPRATRTSTTGETEKPVFILSAGWGSGSTLLQRLVMSSGEVLVWGEPLDQAAPIQRMAAALGPIRPGWPPDNHFISAPDLDRLSSEWVANLVPDIASYAAAHRAFLGAWLGNRAGAVPANLRWGLKEVRLTIDHARYLKWLYPDAKILFIYRDLLASYRSCKGSNWLSVWPTYRVSPPLHFAHHWRFLLEGYLAGCRDVDGLLIKYEDLIAGRFDLRALCQYLGVETLDESLLERKVGSRSSDNKQLGLADRLVLQGVAGHLRRQLGYEQ